MKQPFHIHIDQAVLDDLKHRLANTRWTDTIAHSGWAYGTDLDYLKELCAYWQNDFDWRRQEAYLNSFNHYKAEIGDAGIHFIYEKGKGERSVPLLLTHGYPDSFVRFLKIIPLLTAAGEQGFSFDVVVPSIPGYGFSDKPAAAGMDPAHIAHLFYKLMTEELGYERFMAHGGDWGSSITEQLAMHHGGHLLAIHLTDVPFRHLFTIPPGELSEEEKKYLEAGRNWQNTEGGYAMIQSTKPQSLGYGLNDSPAGLAGWVIEKFHTWSDNHGDLENSFTKDELLTNLSIYWATQTINSAIRIYYETMHAMDKGGDKKVSVPTGVALFPKDLIPAPRAFAERVFNVVRWTAMPRGGHFAAMEVPELLSDELRKFAKEL